MKYKKFVPIIILAVIVGVGAYIVSSQVAARSGQAASVAQIGVTAQTTSSRSVCDHTIVVASTGTASAAASALGGAQTNQVGTFTIPFSVKAVGGTAFIPKMVALSTVAHSTSAKIEDAITAGNTNVSTGTVNAVITYAGNYNLQPDANGNYIIGMNHTENFTLTVVYTAQSVNNYRMELLNIPWSAIDAVNGTANYSTGYAPYTAGLNANPYMTPFVSLQ